MSQITQEYRLAALRHEVIVRPRGVKRPAEDRLVYAAVLEMANYGYRVDPSELSGMSPAALTAMLGDARTVKGADRDMTPIYPGFPQQVQEMCTLTLLVEQIMHYWTGGAFLPNHPMVIREGLPLEDIARNAQRVRVLEAAPAARHFITTLTGKGVAMSEAERALVRGSVAVSPPTVEVVRAALRGSNHGENMHVLFDAVLAEGSITAAQLVTEFAGEMRRVDQLLRLVLAAVGEPIAKHAEAADRAIHALSDKEAYAIRMRTLPRAARRAVVLRLGELTHGFYADFLIRNNLLWRRVMRSIHPYSQIALTEGARRAVDIISANIEYRTLDSLVEEAIGAGDAATAVSLLSENRVGSLLTRCVELLRCANTTRGATALARAITKHGVHASVADLINAYNGVIGANFGGMRVVREAGRTNHMMSSDHADIAQDRIDIVSSAILSALQSRLEGTAAPKGVVGVTSDMAVPLVRRDLSNTDRVVDRGTRLMPVGEGDTLRIFSHWINTHRKAGYLDTGVAVLDEHFAPVTVSTWDTWSHNRAWSTYSGDCLVQPGGSAVEFFDVDLAALLRTHPRAKWAVMTVQSYSGIPLNKVDMIAGTMFRSGKGKKGGPFDARTVTSAFSPTTSAYQALPLMVDVHTGEMVWLDTSSGSTETNVSASRDHMIGPVVRDELARPRLTMGELALMWAQAHGAETGYDAVDRDAVLALLD